MKKVTAIILTGILTLGVLTGCQSNSKAEEKGSSEDAKTIKVAASATPHAEILEQAKSILKKEGYQLEVTVFDDYVQPNEVVESGEFDANYFQHVPYLESFNEEKGTHLVDAGDIHYEPFGIYPGTKKSLDEISEGDKIAVPNDTTNEARALLLLQDNGIITLKDFFQQLLDFFRADFISHMDVISEIIDKRTQFFYLIFFWRLMGTI